MGKYSAAKDMDLKIKTRWYVMANRTQAVIYREGKDRKLHFLSRFANPSGQLMEAELDSDKPGRGTSSAGSGKIRHSLDRRSQKHEESAKRFAREIADDLKTACSEHRFANLVLVAEPHFLGLLRKSLPASLRKLVQHEIAREFGEGSDTRIKAQIKSLISELEP